LKDNVNWILICVTKSTVGYGYVLTLDEGAHHGNMLKSCCCSIMFYYANINYSFFSKHPDNQIVIFEVSSKNVNE